MKCILDMKLGNNPFDSGSNYILLDENLQIFLCIFDK